MSANLFRKVINLGTTTDVPNTISKISEGVSLRGYNVWLLTCSVVLASIGLDVNSAAVIIGAMLISPLMSPILGVGLAVGIHDRELFTRSLRNLGIATLLSLTASTLYFLFTPFGDVTPELLARTHPTLLDVMVAFFGGVAGIVSMSRSESTNAIPGVAIATALMPPLCTAGYGIASGHWDFFLGAFYLYFINALFISLSTFLIVKYLRFPIKQYVDKRMQRRYTQVSWVLLTLALLPSLYFLYTVYQDNKTRNTIQDIVINELEREGNEVLKWELEPTDTVQNIKVYYSGNPLTQQRLLDMEETCRNNGLKSCRVKALRVNLTKEEITGLSTDVARQMLNEWEYKMLEKEKEDSIAANKWRMDVMQVRAEMRAAFPVLDTAIVDRGFTVIDSTHTDTFITIRYAAGKRLSAVDARAIKSFIKLRLGTDTVLLEEFGSH